MTVQIASNTSWPMERAKYLINGEHGDKSNRLDPANMGPVNTGDAAFNRTACSRIVPCCDFEAGDPLPSTSLPLTSSVPAPESHARRSVGAHDVRTFANKELAHGS